MEHSLTERENREEVPEFTIKLITNLTRPPSHDMLNRCAMLYMSAFNKAPWDVYEWKYTPEKAREEFSKLVSTVLDSNGALISLMCGRRPAGFSIATSLGLFIRELKEAEEYKKLPPNYKNPGQYLEKLSQLLKIPLGEFETIGYIADVVADIRHREKGYGRTLIASSLRYLKDNGKKGALAWTVNPAMANLLTQAGFTRINRIGDKGEGIDFTIHHGVWYPTLVLPAKRITIQEVTKVVAQHYLKKL